MLRKKEELKSTTNKTVQSDSEGLGLASTYTYSEFHHTIYCALATSTILVIMIGQAAN